MPQIPLMFILPVFIVFGGACIRLYLLEIKIMKRIKIIDLNIWQDLIWWFGSRAHPFKFRKFIKENKISDEEITLLINSYKKTMGFAFISWVIFAVITVGVTILSILFRKL